MRRFAFLILTVFVILGCGREAPAPAPAGPQSEAGADDVAPAKAEATPSAPASDTPAPDATARKPSVSDDVSTYPEVVAQVGDDTISRDEYIEALHNLQVSLFMRQHGFPPTPHVTPLPALTIAQKAMTLKSMVEARVFSILAEQRGIAVMDSEVDAKLEELKKSLMSESQYRERLQEAGKTEEEFREGIRKRLLMENYGNELIRGFEPTEGQIEQAYANLKKQGLLAQPKSADVAQIYIAVDQADPSSVQEAKARIDKIRERILAGEDFAAVAKEASEDPVSAARGGVYEHVVRGQLGEGFDDRLFTADLNAVSEPFRTLQGWHIMKVLARYEPRDRTLDEVKDELVTMIKGFKQNDAMTYAVQQAWPTMDIHLFVDLDLDNIPGDKVIPIPPEALRDPNALPESMRPAAQAPAENAAKPDAPADSTKPPEATAKP